MLESNVTSKENRQKIRLNAQTLWYSIEMDFAYSEIIKRSRFIIFKQKFKCFHLLCVIVCLWFALVLFSSPFRFSLFSRYFYNEILNSQWNGSERAALNCLKNGRMWKKASVITMSCGNIFAEHRTINNFCCLMILDGNVNMIKELIYIAR